MLKEEVMKQYRFTAILMFIGLVSIVASCASIQSARHNYIMSGQVLDVSGNDVYLCIGHKGGAAVGQEYTVKKFVKAVNPGSKGDKTYFKSEETGVVKVTEIVEEHYAKAVVVSGEVKVNYAVELK